MNLDSVLPVVAAAFALAVACFALLRMPGRLPLWAMAGGLAALAAEALTGGLGLWAGTADQVLRWNAQRLMISALVPGIWLVFSLSYARGNAPDFLRKWRGVVLALLIVPASAAIFFRSRLVAAVVAQSSHHGWYVAVGWPGVVVQGAMLTGSVLVVTNLERTLRAAVGIMRWRIKFMLMAVGLLFAVRGFTAAQALLFRGGDATLADLDAVALIVASGFMARAIRRSSRSEIDVYPSKTVIQGSVTVLLAGLYLLVVGASGKVLARLGGRNLFALEAFLILASLAVLVVLFQSDRLRLRLGQFVSRHFQRPLYDYRTVWLRFTGATISQMDEDELCRSVVRLVAEVFHCLSVSIWVLDPRHEVLNLSASTLFTELSPDHVPTRDEVHALVDYFRAHPEPLPFDEASADLVRALRRLHPNKFRRGEYRICLPMIGRGEVIALLVVGDRVEGTPFSTQDIDLLKCVGDHATANLLNVQFAHDLLQAKEIQSFQTMATFFIHDLKNAASTLSIMLRNLPDHFQDAEFRADALRGMTKSVSHINHVISRLGELRRDLSLRPAPGDLNATVQEALQAVEHQPELTVLREFAPLPPIMMDRDEIGKVATNLVINAREAMNNRGTLRVTTRAEGNWVVLSVQDTGCGMPPNFISESLFRPFQTTKKSGLGIGMFQSKTIVEMHGGRIAVASQLGVGSTFDVYLPSRLKPS